jgi:hypothetical protein
MEFLNVLLANGTKIGEITGLPKAPVCHYYNYDMIIIFT